MYERMNIEDWKAKKKNDRDAVLADQKQALQEVLQDGEHLTAYLLGRGRLGSGITSGNAALVLIACPQATAVMSFDGWNQFGRRVSKGAVGISQLVRSGGYFTVGKVYDRSATYGNKPCPTVELQGEQLGKAVAVLTALSPVDVQFDDKQPTGFLADENLILYPSGASDEEVLARLPADIVLATAAQCYAEVGKRKHSLIAIADKIVRCIRHRVFFIKKFCNMKAADIHIKMNIALIKVRRTGSPYFRVRIPEPKLPSEAVVMFDQAL